MMKVMLKRSIRCLSRLFVCNNNNREKEFKHLIRTLFLVNGIFWG